MGVTSIERGIQGESWSTRELDGRSREVEGDMRGKSEGESENGVRE